MSLSEGALKAAIIKTLNRAMSANLQIETVADWVIDDLREAVSSMNHIRTDGGDVAAYGSVPESPMPKALQPPSQQPWLSASMGAPMIELADERTPLPRIAPAQTTRRAEPLPAASQESVIPGYVPTVEEMMAKPYRNTDGQKFWTYESLTTALLKNAPESFQVAGPNNSKVTFHRHIQPGSGQEVARLVYSPGDRLAATVGNVGQVQGGQILQAGMDGAQASVIPDSVSHEFDVYTERIDLRGAMADIVKAAATVANRPAKIRPAAEPRVTMPRLDQRDQWMGVADVGPEEALGDSAAIIARLGG